MGTVSYTHLDVYKRQAKDDAGKDTFTYGGKTYAVLVTGKKKSDTIRETKYVYDTKKDVYKRQVQYQLMMAYLTVELAQLFAEEMNF